jgi:hypothetical protein
MPQFRHFRNRFLSNGVGGERFAMANQARELADTFFVRPRKQDGETPKTDNAPYPQNDKMNFPSGRTVQALPREVFEEAVRSATLKE